LFFFSSRRRHTRFSRDWSSDVCSSDLRSDVLGALTEVHRSMVLATVAVAVFAATAGVGLASEFSGWTAALAGLLAIVVASRSRMFPLVVEKAPLLAAALVVLAAPWIPWSLVTRWTWCGA